MPGLYKDEGIVLKTIKLGEADRIVTLFTRANGKVRAVAKGIRKTKSRFGGRLEPFTRAQLMIYGGRNLDTITAVDIVTSFDDVRDDYDRIVHAYAMVDLVEKITPERERAVSVYTLLLAGLEALARGGGDSVVVAFTVKMLSVCGYHPHLQTCTGCGTQERLVAFSAALGGVVCDSCRVEDRAAVAMKPAHIGLLSKLLTSDFGQPADAVSVAALAQALKGYAEFHLERPLRSLTFLAAT
jgi:DNA repair protein RecO (recombination protein O)